LWVIARFVGACAARAAAMQATASKRVLGRTRMAWIITAARRAAVKWHHQNCGKALCR
jgi:hypothetical protein